MKFDSQPVIKFKSLHVQNVMKSGNACYYSMQNLLSSRLLSRNFKIKIHRTIILPTVVYGRKT